MGFLVARTPLSRNRAGSIPLVGALPRSTTSAVFYRACLGGRARGNGTTVKGALRNSAMAISSISKSSASLTRWLVSSMPQSRFWAHSKSSRAAAKSLRMTPPVVQPTARTLSAR
jgi:hypothetical protein